MESNAVRGRLGVVQTTRWVLDHWLILFLALFGLFNVLPFVAPVAMRLGWQPVGDLIYRLYAPLCHQMAQRSFFLFGSRVMYTPSQLPLHLNGNLGANMLILKQYTGDSNLGWKVAWSDRMVYMYSATWLVALIYAGVVQRHRVRQFPIWLTMLLLLPMVLDGATHFISDSSAGLFDGFRYTNAWLVQLTGGTLPREFYVGDALGSFNSWMRLLSGLAFGAAVVGFMFPIVDSDMQRNANLLRQKLRAYAEGQRIETLSG